MSTEFPATSSEFDARPTRTPHFYRTQAIFWAREARRPFGLLGRDGGARHFAKHYLNSYRASVATWHTRFGV